MTDNVCTTVFAKLKNCNKPEEPTFLTCLPHFIPFYILKRFNMIILFY